MKFKSKIWMLPLSAAVVFIIGMVVSFLVGNNTSADLQRLRHVEYPFREQVGKVDQRAEQFKLTLQSAASEGDDSKLKDVADIAMSVKAVFADMKKVDGKTAAAQALETAFDAYQTPAIGATRAMLAKGDVGGQVQSMQKALAEFERQLNEQKKAAAQAVDDSQEAAARGVQHGLWIGLMTGAVVLLVLGTASAVIVSSVWKDLGEEPSELRSMMQSIADGDLAASSLTAKATDGTSLRAAVVSTANKLNQTVSQIRNAVDSISTASGEIASGNRDLSVRTEHTASNLQQAASAMEELTSTVGHSAESARVASQLAQTASGAAQRGGGIVSQVVSNMDEINVASRKISEIIGVIDGIAFQTNILALNAAVEAARAGEQGRGFAVVASEVRSLAGRSADAAKEIKVLINVSSDKVDSGSKLVQDAGNAMQDIVAGVQRVTDVIGEISSATTEQSQGIGGVNQSVAELDQMTQQNAALVEQASAAADSLLEQASILAQSVSTFRLRDGTGGASAVPARAPAPQPGRMATVATAQRSAATAHNKTIPAKTKPSLALAAKPLKTAAVKPSAGSEDDWTSF